MKLAFLYAGQGTQHVGMGKDLYETYPAFRAVLDAAKVDFDLKKLPGSAKLMPGKGPKSRAVRFGGG